MFDTGKGNKSPQVETWDMEVPAVIENIPPVTDFVQEHLEEAGATMKAVHQVSVAVDELLSNIAYYAYQGMELGVARVTLSVDKEARMATLVFEDSGIAYDPLKKADPDLDLSLEEREIGGLGIFLVKKTMDGMDYRRENGKNILTLYKKF